MDESLFKGTLIITEAAHLFGIALGLGIAQLYYRLKNKTVPSLKITIIVLVIGILVAISGMYYIANRLT